MHCKKCNVYFAGRQKTCPLCGAVLVGMVTRDSSFPPIRPLQKQGFFILRLALLITVMAGIVCVVINLSTHDEGGKWWSLFVLGGLVSFWCAVAISMYKRRNVLKLIVWQVLVFSGLSILWDVMTGFHRWSLNFVLPILCTLSMIAITLLARVMKRDIRDYMVYLMLAIILCLSSVVLLLCGVLTVTLPTYLCLGASVFVLAVLLIFHGPTFLSEMRRRMHV